MPGVRISELEASVASATPVGALPPSRDAQLPDAGEALREKAKALAAKDPARAANILKAWMNEGGPHA